MRAAGSGPPLKERDRHPVATRRVGISHLTNLGQLPQAASHRITQGSSTNAMNDLETLAPREEHGVNPRFEGDERILNARSA